MDKRRMGLNEKTEQIIKKVMEHGPVPELSPQRIPIKINSHKESLNETGDFFGRVGSPHKQSNTPSLSRGGRIVKKSEEKIKKGKEPVVLDPKMASESADTKKQPDADTRLRIYNKWVAKRKRKNRKNS